MFENVTDTMGRKFDGPVAVGVLGANRAVYAKALGCAPDGITERWAEVHKNYIPPRLVDDGPVMEEIHVGDGLLEHDGILEFPHPISTPGFDPAPYFTSPFWVTKDPETGDRNIGTYRVMVKGADRAGMMAHQSQHIGLHLQSARSQGKMLEAAIIVGCTPAVGLCSVAKIPYGVDEYDRRRRHRRRADRARQVPDGRPRGAGHRRDRDRGLRRPHLPRAGGARSASTPATWARGWPTRSST